MCHKRHAWTYLQIRAFLLPYSDLWNAGGDRKHKMSAVEQVIRTPGKQPTFVQPRPEGGWIIRQGRHQTIRLAADEAELVGSILLGMR
jgi:hypothetical protein